MTNYISNNEFNWPLATQYAFLALKDALTSTHILQLSNYSKAFEVSCDASGTSSGGTLSQEEHPAAFFNEKPNDV